MPLAPEPHDPFLWLEEREGEKALAWVRARSDATEAALRDRDFEAERKALHKAFATPEAIPYIARRGRHVYNFWQAGKHIRGVWRRTTLSSYRRPKPDWEVLIDLDRLAKKEGEDWVWKGAAVLATDQSRALVMLSRGGADAHVLREFDLATRRFVKGGFALPEAKGGAAWLDRDTLVVSRTFGVEHDTASGYPRSIRRWSRGALFADAPAIFEVGKSDMGCWPGVDHSGAAPRLLLWRRPDFFSSEVWLEAGGKPAVKLDLPRDAESIDIEGEWLFLQLRSDWNVGKRTHPAGALLAIRLDRLLGGGRNFSVLFRPTAKLVLSGFSTTPGAVALNILDDVRSRIEIAQPGASGWTAQPVAGLADLATVNVWALDQEGPGRRDDFLVNISTPVDPPTLWLLKDGATLARLKRAPAAFSAKGLAVTRHEARSVDGARIPYFQVGPKFWQRNAPCPALLEGYGGFSVAMLPSYRASTGIAWLAKGHVHVIACLRGGGEFGPAWHKAGMREGKRLAHDDFAAVAADLVRRGVTSPQKLSCAGGSNGGLLVGNMLTRYPERFGGIVCAIPLLDMRRYTKLPAGASWIAEYGDPDRPEDWAFLAGLSPYHNLREDGRYPPILITTSKRDDRVHPGHARKMAAKLAAMGHRVMYHEPAAGGHSAGTDHAQRAFNLALEFAFLRRVVGR